MDISAKTSLAFGNLDAGMTSSEREKTGQEAHKTI